MCHAVLSIAGDFGRQTCLQVCDTPIAATSIFLKVLSNS